jgi:hypothetical protein
MTRRDVRGRLQRNQEVRVYMQENSASLVSTTAAFAFAFAYLFARKAWHAQSRAASAFCAAVTIIPRPFTLHLCGSQIVNSSDHFNLYFRALCEANIAVRPTMPPQDPAPSAGNPNSPSRLYRQRFEAADRLFDRRKPDKYVVGETQLEASRFNLILKMS